MKKLYAITVWILLPISTTLAQSGTLIYELEPIPGFGAAKLDDSEKKGDAKTFEEVKLNLPISDGPYKLTRESTEANYPSTPGSLKEEKF